MAETAKRSNTTDKLVIDIKVNVKTGATTQITNLTKSLTALNEVVKKTANIEKYANALRTIGKELTRTTKNKSAELGGKDFTEQMEVDTPKQNKSTKEQYKTEEKIRKTLSQRIRERFKEWQEARKLRKEQDKTNKSSGFFSKFARSIGRIALYRAIRSSLSGIVKMFQEGLQNIRAFDEATDKSFKKMELSGTTFKNSIASLATGLIQGVQPYITQITDTIGNMVNRFNEAQAVLSGSDTYMKVLTSDTKEWKEQVDKATGSLLEFDKFMSLNQKDNGYTGLVEAKTEMSAEEAEKISEKWQKVLDVVAGIGIAIAGLSLVNFIADLGKVKTLLTNIKSIGTFALIATSITLVVTAVKTLIDNWDKLDTKAKILIPTISVLAGVMAGLITLILAGTKQWGKALAIGGIVAGTIATVTTMAQAQKYAEGGMVERVLHLLLVKRVQKLCIQVRGELE